MANKMDKRHKANVVADKITKVAPHIETLVGMLDEWKLDLILLALGDGEVWVKAD